MVRAEAIAAWGEKWSDPVQWAVVCGLVFVGFFAFTTFLGRSALEAVGAGLGGAGGSFGLLLGFQLVSKMRKA